MYTHSIAGKTWFYDNVSSYFSRRISPELTKIQQQLDTVDLKRHVRFAQKLKVSTLTPLANKTDVSIKSELET